MNHTSSGGYGKNGESSQLREDGAQLLERGPRISVYMSLSEVSEQSKLLYLANFFPNAQNITSKILLRNFNVPRLSIFDIWADLGGKGSRASLSLPIGSPGAPWNSIKCSEALHLTQGTSISAPAIQFGAALIEHTLRIDPKRPRWRSLRTELAPMNTLPIPLEILDPPMWNVV